MKLSVVCVLVFFLSTGVQVNAAERVICTEGAESLQHWGNPSRTEMAFRLDILRMWGLGSAKEESCAAFIECTPDFKQLELNDLQLCSHEGNSGALILLGTVALTDAWGRKDLSVAEDAFRRARKAKSGLPELGLAVVAYLRGDTRRARKLSGKAIERHAEVDDYLIGHLFKFGLLFPQDNREAAYWFMRGAESKDWRAQAALAYMYTTGEGVERNPEKAAELLRAVESNPASHSDVDIQSVITDVKQE